MRIKVLGCSGAGSPGRNSTGFLLGDRILFDAGSLTQVLGRKGQLKTEFIFITHPHLDHITGVPFLAENIAVEKSWHKVHVVGIPPVVRALKTHLLNGVIWPDFTVIPETMQGILNLAELKPGRSLGIYGYVITPVLVNHSVPTAGYLIEEGRRKRVFYTGDTGPSETTWKRLRGIELQGLIIEVSFPNRLEKVAIRTGHLTPRLLRQELHRVEPLPEEVYVTHMKPQFVRTIRSELEGLRIKNLRILKDGDVIKVE